MSGSPGPAIAGPETIMRRGPRNNRRFIHAVSAAAFVLLAAAYSSSSPAPVAGDDPSFIDNFRSAKAIGSAHAQSSGPAGIPGAPKALESCPNMELRHGAGTLTINNNPKDPSAMQLRYQVSVVQMARECWSAGGMLTIRIGVQGRIVLGPAGTHGSVEIPIRAALVEEGAEPKTVYSKLLRVPVTIAEGQPHVSFTHIEELISVPMPSPAIFERYVIYIGFDALGAAQERKPAPKKRTPKQS